MYCNVCNCNLCDLHPRHTSSADCLVINNKNKNNHQMYWSVKFQSGPLVMVRSVKQTLLLCQPIILLYFVQITQFTLFPNLHSPYKIMMSGFVALLEGDLFVYYKGRTMFFGQSRGQLKKRKSKTRRLVPSTITPRKHFVDNHYVYDANGMRLIKTPRRRKTTSSRRRGSSRQSPTEEQLVSGCRILIYS